MKALLLLVLLLLLVPAPSPAQSGPVPPAFTTSGAFFALSVPDLEASSRWYVEKLGLRGFRRQRKPGEPIISP